MTAPASRNDPCPCGSGKKFKRCHMESSRAEAASPADTVRREAARQSAASMMQSNDQRLGQALERLSDLLRYGQPLAHVRLDAEKVEAALREEAREATTDFPQRILGALVSRAVATKIKRQLDEALEGDDLAMSEVEAVVVGSTMCELSLRAKTDHFDTNPVFHLIFDAQAAELSSRRIAAATDH